MGFLKRFLINLAILIGIGIFLFSFYPDIMRQVLEASALFWPIAILFLIVAALPRRRSGKPTDKLEFPYFLRDEFLSPAEQSFYLLLKQSVSDWALICPKVALGDLFYVKSNDPRIFRIYTNKIDRKHVDFLLCDPKTARPLLGIELDDKSHQKSERQARDEFVGMVYKTANLPLVRIPVRHSYSTSELDSLLRQHVDYDMDKTPNQAVVIENVSTPPRCLKCSKEMVLRTAKRGANEGKRFWGCPDYPRCRGIVKYEE